MDTITGILPQQASGWLFLLLDVAIEGSVLLVVTALAMPALRNGEWQRFTIDTRSEII